MVSTYNTVCAHMDKIVRGLIGETSVPVWDITLTSARHVAVSTLHGIRVTLAAWKILSASLRSKADKTHITRYKRPTDVCGQLESRHVPKTMGETSMLLYKYEQGRIASTNDPRLEISALSDIRAQLSAWEFANHGSNVSCPCVGLSTPQARV